MRTSVRIFISSISILDSKSATRINTSKNTDTKKAPYQWCFYHIISTYFFAATDASVVMFTVILSPTFGT